MSAPERSTRSAPRPLRRLELAALFAVSLFYFLKRDGTSPAVWFDTFVDEANVLDCLHKNMCTIVGMGASIPNFFQSAGWLRLLEWLATFGMGLDGVHRVVQVLNAADVTILTFAASRFGGRLAAILLLAILVWSPLPGGMAGEALYNTSLMPFLGSVFLVGAAACVERPTPRSISLLALAAAVIANVHAVGVFCGASVIWIALLAPQQRWRLSWIGGIVFTVALVALSPLTWFYNAQAVLHLIHSQVHATAAYFGRSAQSLNDGLFRLVLVALAVAVSLFVHARQRTGRFHPVLHAALAISVPTNIVFMFAVWLGFVSPAEKYLAHVAGADWVALTGALGSLAMVWPRRFRSSREWTGHVAFGALLIVPLWSGTEGRPQRVYPRIRDVRAMVQLLQSEHWDWTTLARGLRTSDESALLYGITVLWPEFATPDRTPGAPRNALAVLMAVPQRPLPGSLPRGWTVLSDSTSGTVILALLDSALDWSHVEHCVPESGRHGACSLVTEKIPLADCGDCRPFEFEHDPGTPFQLFVPWTGRPGASEEILLPKGDAACGFRIAHVPDGSTVSPGGRQAHLVPGRDADPTVELAWSPDPPGCRDPPSNSYPFLIAGAPDQIRPIAAFLDARGSP